MLFLLFTHLVFHMIFLPFVLFNIIFSSQVDLSGKDKSITKLHKASWVGNLEKVKSHLKKIDVNVVDNSNRTPLHLAAAQGHTHVVWFLLSNKAQMDIIDVGGKTSLLKVLIVTCCTIFASVAFIYLEK